MKKRILLLLGLVFAVLFSASAFADTNVTILNDTNNGNVGDTTVEQGTSNSNYGGASYLVVFSAVNNNMRTFLKFNLSSLPSNMQITSATLYLYFNNMPILNTSGRIYNVYDTPDNTSYLDAPWWEGSQNGGGAGDTASLMWGNQTFVYNLQSQATVPASFGWMSWNVTEGAIDAYGDDRNLSLEIRDNSEGAGSQYQSRFASKEAGSNTPYLVVYYVELPLTDLFACGSLNISNATYLLMSNVTNPSGDCIEITADDIILDCQNNYIKDVDGFGIVGTALSNITIKNCRMENVSWNADAGVEFYGSDDILIEASDIRGTQQGHGVAFRNSTDIGITNSYVDVVQSTAGHGVYWYECDGMYAINNTLSAYTGVGGYAGLRPEYSVHGLFDRNVINGRLAMWEPNVNDSVWTNNIVNGTSGLDGMNDILINNTISGRSGFHLSTYGNVTFVNNTLYSTTTGNPPFAVEGGWSLSDFLGNNISDNVGNGLPVYYFFNRSADIDGLDTYSISCVGCHDMTIKNIYKGEKSGLILVLTSNLTVSNLSMTGHSMCVGANATIIDSKFNNGFIGFDCYWDYPQPFSYITFIDSEIKNNTVGDVYFLNTNVSMFNTSYDTVDYGDSNSFISRYWYLTFSVSGGYNPFNPHVIIRDSKNNTLFDGDSRSVSLTALEYVGTCASPDCDQTTETRDYYTNYTINVSSSSYNKPFAGIFDFSENNNFFINLESKMTGTGDLLTDVGSGVGSFLSAITLGVTNMIVYIAIIMGVLSIFYAIAYVFKRLICGSD